MSLLDAEWETLEDYICTFEDADLQVEIGNNLEPRETDDA